MLTRWSHVLAEIVQCSHAGRCANLPVFNFANIGGRDILIHRNSSGGQMGEFHFLKVKCAFLIDVAGLGEIMITFMRDWPGNEICPVSFFIDGRLAAPLGLRAPRGKKLDETEFFANVGNSIATRVLQQLTMEGKACGTGAYAEIGGDIKPVYRMIDLECVRENIVAKY